MDVPHACVSALVFVWHLVKMAHGRVNMAHGRVDVSYAHVRLFQGH